MIFITISISLLLPRLTQSECQGNSNCLKLESVYHSICNNHAETRTLARGRPGKMGPIGKKGEKGEKGIAVNYEHVEELIRKQIKGLIACLDTSEESYYSIHFIAQLWSRRMKKLSAYRQHWRRPISKYNR